MQIAYNHACLPRPGVVNLWQSRCLRLQLPEDLAYIANDEGRVVDQNTWSVKRFATAGLDFPHTYLS